jgi:hypothetical protein
MAYARRFAIASKQYRPDPIRLLFVAEAPPALASGRFFYFPAVERADTLFLEMMKVLYPDMVGFIEHTATFSPGYGPARVRATKAILLNHFKRDGFYLIDASDQPMPALATTKIKRELIRKSLPALVRRVKGLLPGGDTPIILIRAVTYDVCATTLRQQELCVLNQEMIDHPARGGQRRFRQKLRYLLDSSVVSNFKYKVHRELANTRRTPDPLD